MMVGLCESIFSTKMSSIVLCIAELEIFEKLILQYVSQNAEISAPNLTPGHAPVKGLFKFSPSPC